MCTDLSGVVELSFGEPAPPLFEVLVAGRPDETLLACSSLEALVIPFAGLPEITAERLEARSELPVYNLHHNASASAELALGLLLACAKRLVPIDQRFREGDWSDRGRHEQALCLEERRALVLGYGAIGRRVVRACEGLGLRVDALARTPRLVEGRQIHGQEALTRLLPGAEVLIICLPATPDTRGRIGAAELALLPKGALLVNVGRGPIVDEAALYAALASGHLFGAGLDVWWRYPEEEARKDPASRLSPAEHPFHELESVVLSPHRAGHVEDTELRRARDLAELLRTLARGETPASRVRIREGY